MSYPTWVTKLWLDNDETSYEAVMQMAREADGPYELAEQIKDFTETYMISEPPVSGLASDLYTYALGQVDWQGIAEDYIEEAQS